jgi:hypothetical protein
MDTEFFKFNYLHRIGGRDPWKQSSEEALTGYTVEPVITDTAGEFKFCPL